MISSNPHAMLERTQEKLRRCEEKAGQLEDKVMVCADALDFALRFYRATFCNEPVEIAVEWQNELVDKLENALIEARRK